MNYQWVDPSGQWLILLGYGPQEIVYVCSHMYINTQTHTKYDFFNICKYAEYISFFWHRWDIGLLVCAPGDTCPAWMLCSLSLVMWCPLGYHRHILAVLGHPDLPAPGSFQVWSFKCLRHVPQFFELMPQPLEFCLLRILKSILILEVLASIFCFEKNELMQHSPVLINMIYMYIRTHILLLLLKSPPAVVLWGYGSHCGHC